MGRGHGNHISPGDTFGASVTESLTDVRFIMYPSFLALSFASL